MISHRIGSILGLPFFAAVVAASPAWALSAGVLQDAEKAGAAFQAEDWGAAAAEYRVLVEADRGDAQSWFLLGRSLHELGQLDEALEAYQGAIDNGPQTVPARRSLVYMAGALVSLGRPTEALARLQTFAAPGPSRPALAEMESLPSLAALHHEPRYGDVVKALTPCGLDAYRQFDFWVGSWEVFAPNGDQSGTSTIESTLGGCAIHESWQASTGGSGHSYNFFDSATDQWHQTWVDANGGTLYLNGGFEEGKMSLTDGTNRITWTPLDNGYVRQHWETTSDGGATWVTAFDGEYRPASTGETAGSR